MILIFLIFLLSSNIYCMEIPKEYHSHEDLETGRILDSKKEETEEKKYDTQEMKEIKLEEIFGEMPDELVIDIDDPKMVYRNSDNQKKSLKPDENIKYKNYLKQKIKNAIEKKDTTELICLLNEVQLLNLKKVNDNNSNESEKTLKEIRRNQCVYLGQNLAVGVCIGIVIAIIEVIKKYAL